MMFYNPPDHFSLIKLRTGHKVFDDLKDAIQEVVACAYHSPPNERFDSALTTLIAEYNIYFVEENQPQLEVEVEC